MVKNKLPAKENVTDKDPSTEFRLFFFILFIENYRVTIGNT